MGAWGSLVDALALGPRELVALVGAGGKTSALRLAAEELAAAGRTVIMTTTTAMYERELTTEGPLVLEADSGRAAGRLRQACAASRVVAVAAGRGPEGKVKGLPPSAVDALWQAHLSDYLLVEADGSRGLPFKAFGRHEPVVPSLASTVVLVAGLGAIGGPLTVASVHRGERLAEALGLTLGCEVTPRVFADGLRLLRSALTQGRPGWKVVTLLAGVDSPARERLGLAVSGEVLAQDEAPDAIVLADLRKGLAARATVSAA